MKFYLATGCSVRTDQCYYQIIGLILLVSMAEAHLNLYLNQQETMRLLGECCTHSTFPLQTENDCFQFERHMTIIFHSNPRAIREDISEI
jgi:hypothetical protein